MTKLHLVLIYILQEIVHIKCILGGRNAAEGEFPYHVLIQNPNAHYCVGVIISPRYVLTAGECYNKGLTLRMGTIDPLKGGTEIEVKDFIDHPKYVENRFQYNIALIRTSEDIVYTDFIKPAKLPEVNEQIYGLTKANVTGWGEMSGGVQAKTLQYLQTKTINKRDCEHHFTFPVTDTMICTFLPDAGLCSPLDEGSPLVHDNYVIGIGSNVNQRGVCGKVPDVYINVFEMKHWIETVMNIGSISYNTNMMLILITVEIFVIVMNFN